MRVKTGDRVYDGAEEPVMVILTPGEREQIASMRPEATKYCVYPDVEEWTADDYAKIRAWMADA